MTTHPRIPDDRAGASRVLIVTGSMLTAREPSLRRALVRQVTAMRASSGAWFDLEIKLQIAGQMLGARGYRRTRRCREAPYAAAVDRFFERGEEYEDPPELTEVVLATLLRDAGVPFEVSTYSELYGDAAGRDELLARCSCVFASTTLVRDMSELVPMIAMLKRPDNHIVVGGALAGVLHQRWPGCPGVDVLAVGYGELLVPVLCDWMRGGYDALVPPAGGRVVTANGTTIVYSGVPAGTDLDFLPSPDWTLAEQVHGRKMRHVNYESVRGCPYRCAFCNYPFLFDDTKFRFRSARRIADDWERLYRMGVEYVTCLDSLFTMPRRRLIELCELLVARGIRLKWICYARADDLAEIETCRLMRAAGCIQVQIGIENGSQRMLDNMNKRTTVAHNGRALRNCREVGLATYGTVIVGFPGETPETVHATFEMLRDAPPDIYYVVPFNTRVEYVPILSAANRARFGLRAQRTASSSLPYWAHDTMACTDVGRHMAWFHRQMIEQRVALEGTRFFEGALRYDPADREALLDFQRDAERYAPVARAMLRGVERWVRRRHRRDAARVLADAGPRGHHEGR